MLDEKSRNEIKQIATERSFEPVSLLAVVEVESGGRILATIGKRKEPLIRFEGHYFYRLLGAANRNKAVVRGLAHRSAGRIANPRTQSGRWKLLDKASAIDRDAALQSVSWGVGQVMGSHWRWLDYASIDHLVAEARSGLSGQVQLMARFIEKAGLVGALNSQDWRVFARGYNGPAYAKNDYDKKLAKAYQRYSNQLGIKKETNSYLRHSPLMLRYGDRGDLIREMQLKLQQYGVALIADGDFGPGTQRAIKIFQRAKNLTIDGIVGPKTFEALERLT
ncbi:MAG: N-acetylmuramidase domain-containing protein [Salaquimonas sp.]